MGRLQRVRQEEAESMELCMMKRVMSCSQKETFIQHVDLLVCLLLPDRHSADEGLLGNTTPTESTGWFWSRPADSSASKRNDLR